MNRPNPLLEGRHAISPSKLAKAQECPRAYFYEHVRKIPTGEAPVPMTAGSLVHRAIEEVVTERARSKRLRAPVTPKELVEALYATAKDCTVDAVALDAARGLLTDAAPRLNLALVAQDDHGPMVEVGDVFDAGGLLVGVKVDLVEFVGDDAVVVRDWKSGRQVEDEPGMNPQVSIYAAWARRRFPGREVFVALDYVAVGAVKEFAWDAELEAFGLALARTVVEKARKDRSERAWPAKVGSHCARCPYSGRCDAFAAKLQEPAEGRTPTTLEGLLREYRRVRDLATVAQRRAEKLRDEAKAQLGDLVDRDGRAVVGGGAIKVRLKRVEVEARVQAGYAFDRLDVEVLEPSRDVEGTVLSSRDVPQAAGAGPPIPQNPAPAASLPAPPPPAPVACRADVPDAEPAVKAALAPGEIVDTRTGEVLPAPVPAPPVERAAPAQPVTAEAEELEERVLAILGQNQVRHAQDVVAALLTPDSPAVCTVSTAIHNLLVTTKARSKRQVFAAWKAAGGSYRERRGGPIPLTVAEFRRFWTAITEEPADEGEVEEVPEAPEPVAAPRVADEPVADPEEAPASSGLFDEVPRAPAESPW